MSFDVPKLKTRKELSVLLVYHHEPSDGRKIEMSVLLSPSKSNGAVTFGSSARRSNAPMSVPSAVFGIAGLLNERANPRWSVVILKLLPLSTAGEIGKSACVGTVPPFKESTLTSPGLSGAAPVPV